tara:strand:+ start:352 stop:456 length:105 start_codon:yes stop_codon:yes gene_type:complete
VNDFLRNFVYAGLFILAVMTWLWLILGFVAAFFG